jgi:hypothetical protein
MTRLLFSVDPRERASANGLRPAPGFIARYRAAARRDAAMARKAGSDRER